MAIFAVAAAAVHLGVDETEVCHRITDGRLTSMRDPAGQLCVILDDSAAELTGHVAPPAQVTRTDAQVIDRLQAEVARLGGVCAALRDELHVAHRHVADANQREAQLLEASARGSRSAA